MRDVEILDVRIEYNEVVVSLFGGPDNVCGSLRFYQPDRDKRNKMADEVRALINGHVLVDIAFSITGGRWRLIGKNRTIIGGLEPTKLDISQTFNKPPMPGSWGLDRPWDGED